MRVVWLVYWAAMAVLGAAPANAQSKTLLAAELGSAARLLEKRVASEARALAKIDPQLVADARTDNGAARRRQAGTDAQLLLRLRAAAVPARPQPWLVLARSHLEASSLQQGADSSHEDDPAIAASYVSYVKATAPKDQIAALNALAEGLAAALGRSETPKGFDSNDEVEAALAKIRKEVAALGHPTPSVAKGGNAEGALTLAGDPTIFLGNGAPEICIAFSAAPDAEQAKRFILVKPRIEPKVERDGDQLCVSGFAYSKKYEITFKADLPSLHGKRLGEDATREVTIGSRPPEVWFVGRNYVLPSKGQRGVPVTSTNTERISVSVLRIGERNLALYAARGCAVAPSDDDDDESDEPDCKFFPSAKDARAPSVESIRLRNGEEIWKGELDVAPGAPSAETTTLIPFEQIERTLKPGVYVLTAKPATEAADEETGDEDDPDRDNPSEVATQWLVVTDLGLSTVWGRDGIDIFVRSLFDASPVENAWIRLVAVNNEILGEAFTDAQGRARFPRGLTAAKAGRQPGLVTVVKRSGESVEDYSFVNLRMPAYDLTDRVINGREEANGLDAFVFTDRGVYRPGEILNVGVLTRLLTGEAATEFAVRLSLKQPNGVEYPPDERFLLPDQGEGGRALAWPLPGEAAHGRWTVSALSVADGSQLGSASFLVEDYRPDRIAFDLKSRQPEAAAEKPVKLDVSGRFLFGAPAAGLDLSATYRIERAEERDALGKGFRFGLDDEEFAAMAGSIAGVPITDDKGAALIEFLLPRDLETSGLLNLEVTVEMREAGGHAVKRAIDIPIAPAKPLVGVRPGFSNSQLPENSIAKFELLGLDPARMPLAGKTVEWRLLRKESDFRWVASDGEWSPSPDERLTKVAGGKVKLDARGMAEIAPNAGFGRHRLEVTLDGAREPATSVTFDAGWYPGKAPETPARIEVSFDQPSYKIGETAKIRLAPLFSGQGTVMVLNGATLATVAVTLTAGTPAIVEVPVTEAWGVGAYAMAFVYRPLDIVGKRLPTRAIGAAWVATDTSAKSLSVAIETADVIRPRSTLTVPISVSGVAPGEPVYAMAMVVDIGILNLTDFAPPDPRVRFFAQRRLTAEVRDLYASLINGMNGTLGIVRSGGDMPDFGRLTKGEPPNQIPLAQVAGPLKAGPDGKISPTFEIPNFTGSAKLMVVAWSRLRSGYGERDVEIRDPIVLSTSLPRFLLPRDRSRLLVELNNVEAEGGDYTVEVASSEAVTLAAGVQAAKSVSLPKGERRSLAFDIEAGAIPGEGHFEVRLSGPAATFVHAADLPVAPFPTVSRLGKLQTIDAGKKATIAIPQLQGVVPGSARVALSVSPLAPINVGELLRNLETARDASTQEIVSRAFPLLLASRVVADWEDAARASAGVQEAVNRLALRQSEEGSFLEWPNAYDSSSIFLDSYVSHFLIRAAEQPQYAIPKRALRNALGAIWSQINEDTSYGGELPKDAGYGLFVLASAGGPGTTDAGVYRAPVVGFMRDLVDLKLDEVDNLMSLAGVAAALGVVNDRARSQAVVGEIVKRLDQAGRGEDADLESLLSSDPYATPVRDFAGVLALASDSGASPANVAKLSLALEGQQKGRKAMSSQEATWMVLAADSLMRSASGLDFEVNGRKYTRPYHGDDLEAVARERPIVVTNRGKQKLKASVFVSGAASEPPPPSASDGLTVQRTYHTLDGALLKDDRVVMNDRVVVVLRATIPKTSGAAIVDPIPAGFEIENPRLADKAKIEDLIWLPELSGLDRASYGDRAFSTEILAQVNEGESDGSSGENQDALLDEADETGQDANAGEAQNGETDQDSGIDASASNGSSDGSEGETTEVYVAYTMRAIVPGRYTRLGATVADVLTPDEAARTGSSTVEIRAAP